MSNEVTKVVNVPVLKDHWTAGVTCALKNVTYGCVNNTARSHTEAGNWIDELVPAIALMPKLREKVVLHIADLLVACYAAGPDPSTSTFDYGALLFATDPVALDRIAWQILDAQRAKMALPPVADMPERKPQYVLRCADAGLGIADIAKIDHRVLTA